MPSQSSIRHNDMMSIYAHNQHFNYNSTTSCLHIMKPTCCIHLLIIKKKQQIISENCAQQKHSQRRQKRRDLREKHKRKQTNNWNDFCNVLLIIKTTCNVNGDTDTFFRSILFNEISIVYTFNQMIQFIYFFISLKE